MRAPGVPCALSISKFQNVIHGGCGRVFIVGISVVFVGGLLYQGCGGRAGIAAEQSGASRGAGRAETEIAQVAGAPVTAGAIQAAQERLLGGQPMPPTMAPAQELALAGAALSGAIETTNALALAKGKGIDTSDAAVLAFVGRELPKILKEQVLQSPGMKPDASDADVDAFVKKQAGKGLGDLVKEQLAGFTKSLADPQKGPAFRAQVIPLLVIDAGKAKIQVSDEELRKSFDVVEVKRLVVPSFGTGGPDDAKAKAKADEALAAIRGGLSFDAALDKYSSSAGAPGQKPSAAPPLPVPASQIGENPQYKALVGLKPGDVSNVERGPEGYILMKIVGAKSNLPKDFETRKERYLDALKTQRSQKAFTEELKRFGETNPPKFSSDGYAALYAYTKLTSPPSSLNPAATPPAPTEAQFRGIIDGAKRVGKSDEGYRLATLVRAQAFDRLYALSKNQPALADERIETLLASVEAKDDFDARLTLVDAYLGKRDYKAAAEQLQAAARANTQYDAQGQDRFGKIASKLIALKKDGQLPADLEAGVQGEQDRWRNEKKAADDAQAQAAKLQAEDAKRQADAQKAAEAAAKKAKANPRIEDVTPPKK